MELLTVSQVAKLLKWSVKSVYNHADVLGGFYPFGVKTLRFDKETLIDSLQRQAQRKVSLRLSAAGQTVHQRAVQAAPQGRAGRAGKKGANQKTGQTPAEDRHGL